MILPGHKGHVGNTRHDRRIVHRLHRDAHLGGVIQVVGVADHVGESVAAVVIGRRVVFEGAVAHLGYRTVGRLGETVQEDRTGILCGVIEQHVDTHRDVFRSGGNIIHRYRRQVFRHCGEDQAVIQVAEGEGRLTADHRHDDVVKLAVARAIGEYPKGVADGRYVEIFQLDIQLPTQVGRAADHQLVIINPGQMPSDLDIQGRPAALLIIALEGQLAQRRAGTGIAVVAENGIAEIQYPPALQVCTGQVVEGGVEIQGAV